MLGPAYRVAFMAAAVVTMAVPIDAKVPLDRIVVSGGGLPEPVTVTDAEALRLSNPWHGSIAEWTTDVVAPPADRPVYEVLLHARLRGSEGVGPIYQLRYVEGAGGQAGYVYIPGRGETGYAQNVSIVYREGHDGHWHTVLPEWEASMRRALGR